MLEAPVSGALTPGELAGAIAHSLECAGRPSPALLAELLRDASGAGEYATALRHVVQDYLLGLTIEHAREHTAYYRESVVGDWSPTTPGDPPSLESIPVLRRETVVENFDDFIADDVTVRSVCHTSGTTGTPLELYKSFEEIDFIQRYYWLLFKPLVDSMESRPLVFSMPNVNHGVPVPMPSIGMTFVGGVTDDTLVADACRVLHSTFRHRSYDSRVSIVTGLPHHVLLLTSYLHEQGIDPRSLELRGVTITGGFLATNWIEFLAESWGCLVHDRFTLTEAIGGASRIPLTDVYELDPHIVGEIVDPDADEPADDPVGLLVLTNLFPFVQMQPLIRYTVGDLVRKVPGPGPLRFQFLGKARNCVSWVRNGRREWLLFSTALNEIVSRFPDVNVHEWFSNVRSLHDRTIGSMPIVSVTHDLESERPAIRVAVELRYAPHTRRARVDELRKAIVGWLRQTPDTALALRVDRGELALDVELVGPGALDAPLVIKV